MARPNCTVEGASKPLLSVAAQAIGRDISLLVFRISSQSVRVRRCSRHRFETGDDFPNQSHPLPFFD